MTRVSDAARRSGSGSHASGTSSFHGSAYEFVRTANTNANSYFNKQQGLHAHPITTITSALPWVGLSLFARLQHTEEKDILFLVRGMA